MRNRITMIAGTAAFAGALALGTAGAAMAGPNPGVAPHYGSNGVAGYEVTTNTPLNDLTTVITPNPTFANIGAVGQGGAGDQLYDPNTGYAAQVGLVSLSATTEGIDYQAGTQASVDSGVLPGALPLNAALQGLKQGDVVQVWMSHWNVVVSHRTKGHWTRCFIKRKHHRTIVIKHCHWIPGHVVKKTVTRILFQGQDVTTQSEVFSKTITAPAQEWFDSTAVGVEQDTTGMAACGSPTHMVFNLPEGTLLYLTPKLADGTQLVDGTCNDTVDFSDVHAGSVPVFGGPAASPITEWVTSGGGVRANPVLVGPGFLQISGGLNASFPIETANATNS